MTVKPKSGVRPIMLVIYKTLSAATVWLRGTVVERRSVTGELSLSTLDL